MTGPVPPAFSGLALALAIGFLIGVERGWRQRDEEAGGRVAGIRTFSLVGLLGGLVGLLSQGPLAALALLLAVGAVAALLIGYHADMREDHNVSATSTLAAVVTLGLGATATAGSMALASVGAGAAVILLASREALHKAIESTSDKDMRALLRLVLVAFVILPLLPDQPMGPFGALNPQRLWLVVVAIGAISFVGYVLARWLGSSRGALIAGALGSLVSSTAVTVASARSLAAAGGRSPGDEAAIAVASVIMLLRSLLLVGTLAPIVFAPVAALLLPGLAVAVVAAGFLLLRDLRAPVDGAAPPSPPRLLIAILFGALVAGLTFVSAWAQASLGGGSGAAVIAVGGMVDVDAAIATVGTLPPETLPIPQVALALAAPVLFNSLLKLGLLLAIARGAGRGAAAALAATAAALALALAIQLTRAI